MPSCPTRSCNSDKHGYALTGSMNLAVTSAGDPVATDFHSKTLCNVFQIKYKLLL